MMTFFNYRGHGTKLCGVEAFTGAIVIFALKTFRILEHFRFWIRDAQADRRLEEVIVTAPEVCA